MNARRLIALLVAAIVAALGGLYRSRNPEHMTLDAAARQGVAGQFVALGDGVTHYDVAGPDTGQRVVLIHGFSVPYYIWDSTTVALAAAGFRVARYDHFGRGYSDRPATRYTADLFDRQLVQLLDSLGWRAPVDVIGLSMGGPVAGVFAGRHPERTRTMTLVDPAAGPRGSTPWFFGIPTLGPVLWQMLAVPGMADGQSSDFVEPGKWPDWADRYRVQMQFRGFGQALLSTRRESEQQSTDSVYARAGATHVPTLLIWGREDQTVRIEHAANVQRAIPQAQFHPIDRAGHLPHMERTDVVNPLLIGFLRAGRAAPADSVSLR